MSLSRIYSAGLSLSLGFFLMTAIACSPQPEAVLQDDPTSENTPVGGNTGAETPTEPSLPIAEPEAPAPGLPTEELKTYFVVPTYTAAEKSAILATYAHLDPARQVPTALLQNATLYFHKNKHLLKNKNVMSVIDFSKRSSLKRFFIITMSTGSVWAIHTAHGKGSDSNHDGYAEKFSNTPNSNMSSVGAYVAAESYSGSHGLSLRLDGKSTTNSNARSRAIVIHGADYVQDANVIQGRSWGCPAVAMSYRDRVVNTLKGGSLIFAGLSN